MSDKFVPLSKHKKAGSLPKVDNQFGEQIGLRFSVWNIPKDRTFASMGLVSQGSFNTCWEVTADW